MGIELDVLVGHPEHELLFVATQVARAAGLSHPSESIRNARLRFDSGYSLSTLMHEKCISLPLDSLGRRMRSSTVFFTESDLYAMLIRGHAPQSEPFRRWVLEEVLPTIRKTGSYNAESSQDPIAMGIMNELKALRGELAELKGFVQALNLSAPQEPVKSPYDGDTKGTVHWHCRMAA